MASLDIYDRLSIPRKPVSLSKQQAEYIYYFLLEKNIKKTLEVGFCYGCSAAHIIAATQSVHYAIDPWQQDAWDNIGIKNLESLGLRQHLKLQSELSHTALPELLNQNLLFDFALIDGDHKFDTVMLDFYYVDKLLNLDGYVVFDDIELPAIQKVVAWIQTNRRDYQPIPLNVDMPSTSRSLTMFQKTQVDERTWDHFESFDAY